MHFGSLVAAVGSYLFAKSDGGAWLVRMEDLDGPRVVPGSADEILRALERYALAWDGEVVYQSSRIAMYVDALGTLRERGLVYDCGCSRADLLRAASAPAAGDAVDAERIYPGTCRDGLPPGKVPRAVRFRAPDRTIAFDDLVRGRVEENVAQQTGDFVVRRADGVFAYQLAVVVDDALQEVTQVVRGGDLLSSTARQIALQEAFGYPTPQYAHLPLIVTSDGAKLGKRDGALPLPELDVDQIRETLREALAALGQAVEIASPEEMLREAVTRFNPTRIPRGTVVR